MAIPSILGRRLIRPTLNLGVSGNGRMEAEVGSFLGELNPCVFAVDCVPNMNETMIDERAVPLVRQLRQARPKTPILLVEDRSFASARFFPRLENRHRSNRAALRRAFAQLQDEGVDNLYYLDGEQLLGDDGEAATDGSHPSDLGMVRYADAYEIALRDILQQF
jgi:lysophospholipase L1-like esterase